MLTNIVRIVANLLVLIYIARKLSIDEFGIVSFSITFSMIFAYLISLGLDRLVIIQMNDPNTDKSILFGSVFTFEIILAVFVLILVGLTGSFLGYKKDLMNLIYIMIIAVMFTSFIGLTSAGLRGIGRMDYELLVSIINNSVLLLSIFIMVNLNLNILLIGVAFLIPRILAFGVSLQIFQRRVTRFSLKFDLKLLKKILSGTAPLGLIAIFAAVLSDLDSVILMQIGGETPVGYYQAAAKLITTLTVIPFILEGSFFPLLSSICHNKESLQETAQSLLVLIMFSGIIIMSGLYFFSDTIIYFLYGGAYYQSGEVLQILSFALLLRFLMKGFEIILVTLERAKFLAILFAGAIVINGLLNVFLIPIIGIKACAFASVISNAASIIFLLIMADVLQVNHLMKKVILPTCAFVFLIVILNTITGTKWNIIVFGGYFFLWCFVMLKYYAGEISYFLRGPCAGQLLN